VVYFPDGETVVGGAVEPRAARAAEGQSPDQRFTAGLQFLARRCALGIAVLNGAISRRRVDALAICPEEHVQDRLLVLLVLVGRLGLAPLDLPDQNLVIVAARGQPGAIRTEGHPMDPTPVSGQETAELARASVPESHLAIVAASRQQLA